MHTENMVAIYEAIQKIADRNEGRVPPEEVVKAAEKKNSPLHHYFEWDDTEAGRLWRLAQAEGLIRRVKIHVIRKNEETKQVDVIVTRKYQSSPMDRRSEEGSYMEVGAIMADPERRDAMVESVLTELRAIRRRHSQIVELASVWSAIDEAEVTV